MKEKIYIRDFFQLVKRYLKPIAIILVVTVLCFVELGFILPKTFKSEFEINIYPKYFYNALISDIVPGTNSAQEMTQTVGAMVKEVMNDQLIDEIGNEYHIYPKNLTQYELAKERASLRESFEMFSGGGNTFHISFIHGDPAVTLAVSNKVLEAVKNHFIKTRISTIEFAQQTILKKLESANASKQLSDSEKGGPLTTKNPAVLMAELAKIQQEINSLKLQFNSSHPSIVKLEQQKAGIQEYLKDIGGAGTAKDDNDEEEKKGYAPVLMSNDKETSKSITSKLYTNFNNINIALDIERESVASYIGVTQAPQFPTSPLFPKKRLFASLGLIIGLVFCFVYILYKEVINSAPVENAKKVAEDFRGNYFGKLPHINESDLMSNKVLLIEDVSAKYKLEYNPKND
jgi:capsular polysaccharide biosynthesis protein